MSSQLPDAFHPSGESHPTAHPGVTPGSTTPPMASSSTAFPASGAIPMSAQYSPERQPSLASSHGVVSIKADEARSQMKFDLRDKICILGKSDNFWNKVLKTDRVLAPSVETIRGAIQDDVKTLCQLVENRNSIEEHMYVPLTKILRAITRNSESGPNAGRFWKDYHTKYPGVDPDVFISGLEREKGPLGVHMSIDEATAESQIRHNKKRKTGNAEFRYMSPGSGDGDQDVDEESYQPPSAQNLKRKASSIAETPRPVDFRKPDWILLDGDSAGKIPKSPFWRHIAVIFELKVKPSNAPTKPRPDSTLIVQCAEYARLHLALRPFQRFSIHFSLCGNLFSAWLIDRLGVIISDTVDISTTDGLETFIRAVVQVTTNLTAYDLGMDPTVSIVGGRLGDATIPRFAVNMPSKNVYITKGTPVWQTASLFGRGTMVWNVEEGVEGGGDAPGRSDAPTFILKTAYRNPERYGESSFYRALQRSNIPGLAVFKEGGDVELPEQSGPTNVTVENNNVASNPGKATPTIAKGRRLLNHVHREGLTDAYGADSIAHRLVLESKGRRLSEYHSVIDVLRAVLDSVKGHESLYNRGILHRDISIGNVFISDDPNNSHGVAGFLGDLDMAKVYDPTKLATEISLEEAEELVKTTGSGKITGTAQFMALSLLLETSKKQLHETSSGFRFTDPGNRPARSRWYQQRQQEKTSVEPNLSLWEIAARNDLESFLWVMIYAFCLREMNSRPNNESIEGREWYLKERFIPVFGAVSFRETHATHNGFLDTVLNSDDDEAKASYFPHGGVWVMLEDLMTCARDGELGHAMFKETLGHYIKEQEKFIAAQNSGHS